MNEAEILFTDILNCNRQKLYLNKGIILDMKQRQAISQALKRRINGEPLQYILGKTEFMGMEFRVNRDVFIPRPETEILVERAVKAVREFASWQVGKLRILDLGTGSGCIAVSLAKLLPNVDITATDISLAALEMAKDNARLNNVNISFIQSNLFDAYELRTTSYELIISNPPYVAAAEINGLQPEISYEPKVALEGGGDGLDFYRQIICESPQYLKRYGFLIMEMGFNQCLEIKEILRHTGRFEIIEVVKDYGDIDRVIVAQYV